MSKITITPEQSWFLWKTVCNNEEILPFIQLICNEEPLGGHPGDDTASTFLHRWAEAFNQPEEEE